VTTVVSITDLLASGSAASILAGPGRMRNSQ
jgi:hypothetical protein